MHLIFVARLQQQVRPPPATLDLHDNGMDDMRTSSWEHCPQYLTATRTDHRRREGKAGLSAPTRHRVRPLMSRQLRDALMNPYEDGRFSTDLSLHHREGEMQSPLRRRPGVMPTLFVRSSTQRLEGWHHTLTYPRTSSMMSLRSR
jgi:hypothetical protein